MSQFYENLDLHVQTIHAAMTGVRGMFEDEVTALIGTYGVRLSQAAVEDDSIRAMTVKNVDGMTRFIEALDDAERARLSLYAQEYRDLDSRTGMILLCPGDFSSEDCLKIIRRLEHQHVSSAKRLEVARKEISESLTKDEQEHSVRTFELMLRAERLWLLIRQSDSATMRGGVA